MVAWGVAALIVIVVVGALVYAGRKKPAPAPDTLQPADAYAASLPLSQFAMSESENLSGGKLTYLDGHVQNTGNRTVTGITVQVVFQNDVALAPQIDTVPLTLIRMKEPYIDTEPVSAAPAEAGRRPRVPADLRDPSRTTGTPRCPRFGSSSTRAAVSQSSLARRRWRSLHDSLSAVRVIFTGARAELSGFASSPTCQSQATE